MIVFKLLNNGESNQIITFGKNIADKDFFIPIQKYMFCFEKFIN